MAANTKKAPAAAKSAPKSATAKAKQETIEAANAVTEVIQEKAAEAQQAIKETVAQVQETVQEKAKAAAAFGTKALDEVKELTKGNVDALIESGKILGNGIKAMGSDYAGAGKAVATTIANDVKGLSDIRSGSAFVKFQSNILSRNVKTVKTFGTAQAEGMTKLVRDTAAPLSKRVSITVEKLRKVA